MGQIITEIADLLTVRFRFKPRNDVSEKVKIRNKVYQLLAQGRWFFPDTPASSTTKTGRHDIAEILLKVELNNKINSKILF